MNIIQKQPNPIGAFSPIQSWSGETPPDGYYEVADNVTLTDGGFGALTIENDIVTAFTGDTKAFETWKASMPKPTPPEPTIEEKNRADIDYLAIMTGVDL